MQQQKGKQEPQESSANRPYFALFNHSFPYSRPSSEITSIVHLWDRLVDPEICWKAPLHIGNYPFKNHVINHDKSHEELEENGHNESHLCSEGWINIHPTPMTLQETALLYLAVFWASRIPSSLHLYMRLKKWSPDFWQTYTKSIYLELKITIFNILCGSLPLWGVTLCSAFLTTISVQLLSQMQLFTSLKTASTDWFIVSSSVCLISHSCLKKIINISK